MGCLPRYTFRRFVGAEHTFNSPFQERNHRIRLDIRIEQITFVYRESSISRFLRQNLMSLVILGGEFPHRYQFSKVFAQRGVLELRPLPKHVEVL
jgi:hypothetical protein